MLNNVLINIYIFKKYSTLNWYDLYNSIPKDAVLHINKLQEIVQRILGMYQITVPYRTV